MNKLASIIDYVRDNLPENIWDISEDPELKESIKDQILDVVYSALDDADLPEDALLELYIYGSLLTNQYNSATDLDCRIVLDPKITYETLNKSVTGDVLFDALYEKIMGIELSGTEHILNCTIIIKDEKTELGKSELGSTEEEPVYDVLKDIFIVDPALKKDFDPDEAFKEDLEEADKIMQNLDDILLETKKSVIDYQWLEDAVSSVKEPDKLVEKLENKLLEIEDGLSSLVDAYEYISDKRQESFDKPEDKHTDSGNVQFKYLEKYFYIDVLKKIKRIFNDGVSPEDVEDVAEVLHVKKAAE